MCVGNISRQPLWHVWYELDDSPQKNNHSRIPIFIFQIHKQTRTHTHTNLTTGLNGFGQQNWLGCMSGLICSGDSYNCDLTVGRTQHCCTRSTYDTMLLPFFSIYSLHILHKIDWQFSFWTCRSRIVFGFVRIWPDSIVFGRLTGRTYGRLNIRLHETNANIVSE